MKLCLLIRNEFYRKVADLVVHVNMVVNVLLLENAKAQVKDKPAQVGPLAVHRMTSRKRKREEIAMK